jgi:glutathione peroxidase
MALQKSGLLPTLSFFMSRIFGRHQWKASGSIYDFTLKNLLGEEVALTKYKNKKLLIVNTASKCGFTNQYDDLQKLHEQYGDRVNVLGFPSNDFLWQEPGNNETIAEFCRISYGVTFPMFEKISVKGNNMHPLYQWLTVKSGHSPSWNFCKYIVDENGNVQGFFPSRVTPFDPEILNKVLA